MSDKSWEPGMFWKTWKTFTPATFATFTLSFTLSRHAEQLLFSCLCSKVTLTLFRFHYFRYFHYFHNFQSLIQSLSTCWTSFVFMSMLKSRCLLPKTAMVFFDIISSSTLSCDIWVHRAGSQLKTLKMLAARLQLIMLANRWYYWLTNRILQCDW